MVARGGLKMCSTVLGANLGMQTVVSVIFAK